SSEVKSIPTGLSLKDDEGNDVDLASLAESTGVVLFAYPKANTPGCTTQACKFRDEQEKFEELGYKVFGISYDTPKAQASWKAKYNLSYSLLSDDKAGKSGAIKQLGIAKGSGALRSHFVFAKGGALLSANRSAKPANSTTEALEVATAHPQK
ncbi:thioredoxin-like protein, partial [Blastocladiella britannica]